MKNNKRDEHLFKNITDKIKMLKSLHKSTKSDPLEKYIIKNKLKSELYSELNESEMKQLLKYIKNNLTSEEAEIALKLLNEVAAFTDTKITGILKKMIDLSNYDPGYLFRNAGHQIASLLINRLPENKGEILRALAWVGDSSAVEKFSEWRKSPPEWSKGPGLAPEEYAIIYAGWELTRESSRRDLYLHNCYSLVDNPQASEFEAVGVCTESTSTCKWCQRKITNIFEFDLKSKVLDFIPFVGEKLTISTCEWCACYGCQLFMKVGPNGKSEWLEYSIKSNHVPDYPDDPLDRLPITTLKISPYPRFIYQSVDWCISHIRFSQVGGYPAWIQSPEFVKCPKCNKRMIFIAQLSIEDIMEYGEGIFYGFLCPDCSITTVRYQQS